MKTKHNKTLHLIVIILLWITLFDFYIIDKIHHLRFAVKEFHEVFLIMNSLLRILVCRNFRLLKKRQMGLIECKHIADKYESIDTKSILSVFFLALSSGSGVQM